MEQENAEQSATRRNASRALITIATFGAAAALGGLLKIPSPVGSIGLDSAPGFFCAAFFGPIVGAAVGAIGHLGSAATAGFPLGGWLHANVAVHMAVWSAIFGALTRSVDKTWFLFVAAAIAAVLNAVASPMLLIPAGLPKATAIAIIPFLSVAALLNLGLAAVALIVVSKLGTHDI